MYNPFIITSPWLSRNKILARTAVHFRGFTGVSLKSLNHSKFTRIKLMKHINQLLSSVSRPIVLLLCPFSFSPLHLGSYFNQVSFNIHCMLKKHQPGLLEHRGLLQVGVLVGSVLVLLLLLVLLQREHPELSLRSESMIVSM